MLTGSSVAGLLGTIGWNGGLAVDDDLWGGIVFQLPVTGRLCLFMPPPPRPGLPRPIGYADQLSGHAGWADILAPAVQRPVSSSKAPSEGSAAGRRERRGPVDWTGMQLEHPEALASARCWEGTRKRWPLPVVEG